MQPFIKYLAAMTAMLWGVTFTAAVRAEGIGYRIGSDLASIPFSAYVIVTLLSGIGGFVSTLIRLSNEPDEKLVRWKLLVLRDMAASLLAGIVVFFWSESARWETAQAAIMITLAGFGGTKVLDILVDKFFTKREPQ